MAFLTITDVKTEINMSATDTTYDTLLGVIVTGVLNLLDNLTRRTWAQADLIEYYDGLDCQDKVFLRNYPVLSKASTSVWDDPDWEYGASDLIATSDFQVDLARGIIYYDSRFFQSTQNIKVTYTAGYLDADFPYKEILIRQAAHWFKQARNQEWDISSKANPAGAGSTGYKALVNNLLPDFVMIVEQEKRVG